MSDNEGSNIRHMWLPHHSDFPSFVSNLPTNMKCFQDPPSSRSAPEEPSSIPPDDPALPLPALFQTCRQLNQEAWAAALKFFRFDLFGPDTALWFLRKIGPEGRKTLREIELMTERLSSYRKMKGSVASEASTVAELLSECQNLRYVKIDLGCISLCDRDPCAWESIHTALTEHMPLFQVIRQLPNIKAPEVVAKKHVTFPLVIYTTWASYCPQCLPLIRSGEYKQRDKELEVLVEKLNAWMKGEGVETTYIEGAMTRLSYIDKKHQKDLRKEARKKARKQARKVKQRAKKKAKQKGTRKRK